MQRLLIFIFILPITLLAYSDSDLDGVDDSLDQCRSTPLTELVDLKGCTIKNLVSNHHFEVSLGESYAQEGNLSFNFSQVQLAYYNKAFSLSLSGSYYDIESSDYSDSGLNDVYLDTYYQMKPMDRLRVQFGVGVVFPTYDSNDNATDYRASMQSSYKLDKLSLFASLGATLLGDSSETIAFQNTYFYTLGFGYYLSNNFYSSLSYSDATSIYASSSDIQTLSYYGYYKIDNHWFSSIRYAYGLSDNALDNTVGIKIGYYW